MLSIASINPFSTVDYPGKIAAVLYTQGCSWDCGYCHNKSLRRPRRTKMDWEDVLKYLRIRRRFIDAVIITGGEPLNQKHLKAAITSLKERDYNVGIHTNGMDYEKFTDIVGMLDWVGLDIKAPKNKYDMVTGIENSYHDVHHVLKYLVKHKTMDYEIRTTLARDLNRDDIINLATELKQGGVKSLVLQRVTDVTRNYNSMLTAAQSIISNTFLR